MSFFNPPPYDPVADYMNYMAFREVFGYNKDPDEEDEAGSEPSEEDESPEADEDEDISADEDPFPFFRTR